MWWPHGASNFPKAMHHDFDDGLIGLIDLVSNLLAIFVLLFLLSLLLGGAASGRLQVKRHGVAREVIFASPALPAVAPLHDYIVVSKAGYSHLNLAPTGRGLAGETGTTGKVPIDIEGEILYVPFEEWTYAAMKKYGLKDPQRRGSDLDEYRIVLDNLFEITDEHSRDLPVEEAAKDFFKEAKEQRRVLSFIVLEDGFDRFQPLHRWLVDKGLCFRWEPWKHKEAWIRFHSPSQFGAYYNRRCAIPGRN